MGKRHRAAPTRLSGARKTLLAAGAVALVGVLVVAGYRVLTGQKLWCGSRHSITVAADPMVVDQVQTLVDEAAPSCVDLDIQAATGADLASAVAERRQLPDLWVPAGPTESDRVSRDAQHPFETVINSIAATPVLIVDNGLGIPDSDWTAALATPGLRVADPVTSAVADAAMMAAASEVETAGATQAELDQSVAILAQGQGEPVADEAALLDQVAESGGAAVVTERELVSRPAVPGPGRPVVPASGTSFLTFPLVITSQDVDRRDRAREVADELGRELGADAFLTSLTEAGLRTADRAPLSDGRGVGERGRLVVRDPAALDRTLRTWHLLSRPTNSIALVDSSASMGFDVPGAGTSRMGVMVQALERGLALFNGAATLGLWTFNASDDGVPYTELVPMARNDAPGSAGDHRADMQAGIDALPQYVGGGTDLYTSVLAAVTEVQSNYDPNAFNSVMVFSDGANDAVSPMTEEQFLSELRQISDPARPVIVVTIGIMEDADPATLTTIAEATGGSSHIARTPEEIPEVFAAAIARRGSPA